MTFKNESGIAMINGEAGLLADAKISLMDRGLLFGHAVFETLLVYNGNIVEWNDHYNRLQMSCRRARLLCPKEKKLFKDCLLVINQMHILNDKTKEMENLDALKPLRFSLKIMITGGSYSNLFLPLSTSGKIENNVYIVCQKASQLSLEHRFQGFMLKSFLDKRNSFLIGIKSTNYLFHFLCLEEAKESGFDDAIFINHKGEYTEGMTSSFLWFDDKYRVFSTPTHKYCLQSTSILKLVRNFQKEKISFKYQTLKKNQMANCAGCALVSSVRGLVPIKSIDDFSFDIKEHVHFFKYLIGFFNV